MNETPPESGIRADADRCVKCGLCLPHCPTWRVHRREADSPRGRVELIAALASGRARVSPVLQERLDGCLLCRSCETVCPARVPFGRLMDQARARWPGRRPWWTRLFGSRAGRALARFGLRLAVSSGLARLGGPLLGLLPDSIAARRARVRATGGSRVGLFPGCVSDTVDRATLNDAARLLARCGAEVVWAEGAGCCGALDRHQGEAARADATARGNVQRIDARALDRVVSVATACAAEFREYPRLLGGAEAARWAEKHRDVMEYLAERRERLEFRSLRATVLLHHPCSARNVLRETSATIRLLEKVPDLRVVESRAAGCCGAAGVAMFRFPRTAVALAREIVEEATRASARILVTSNIGCALHLRGACRAAGLDVTVQHPVNLLRERLRD